MINWGILYHGFGIEFDVGFSGHHKGIALDIAAYTLGANYIERHVTDDRARWGTDQASSLAPEGMKTLSSILLAAHKFFGDGIKRISKTERLILQKFKYWK